MDIEALTDISDIRKTLDKLRALERAEDEQLWAQLGRHNDLEVKMSALKRMGPKMSKLGSNAEKLASTVGSTCNLAQNVSSKVRELDMIKSRLQETITRVDEIIDLRTCVDGVDVALKGDDIAGGAAHIQRFLRFDPDALEEHANLAVDGGESPADQLRRAHRRVAASLNDKFDAAAAVSDLDEVKRMAQLFPLVGELEPGLAKYARYLAAQVATAAESLFRRKLGGEERLTHAKLVSTLVEGIASMVQRETPFVTQHFGHGRMVAVMQGLQQQGDVQLGKILSQFLADLNVENKVKLVLSRDRDDALPAEIDPKQLEAVLGELITLIQRSEIFCRFIRAKVESAVKEGQEHPPADPASGAVAVDVDPVLISRLTSDIKQRVQVLIGYYLPLEEHVLRVNIGKAVELNAAEGAESLTTTIVDDAFFVIQKSARRAMSSINADCLCAVVNQIRALLETEYLMIFKAQIEAGLGKGSLADLTGALRSSFKASLYDKKVDKPSTQNDLLIALNNAAVSKDFTEKLQTDLTALTGKSFASAGNTDREKISSCLAEFASSAAQFEELIGEGLKQMCSANISGRVRSLVDAMLSSDYSVSEEELGSLDGGSAFVVGLIAGLTKLTAEYQRGLLKSNYDTLLVHITETVAANLERVVLQVQFNQLGGMLYDKDLRVLMNFLSTITQWSLRTKFSRCSQMATLLTLDKVAEVTDYYGKGNVTWRLSPAQVKELLRCRVDLDPAAIAELVL